MGRLIWLHVPNSISKSPNDLSAKERAKESDQMLLEKRAALGLVQGFAVAVKHHLRGEPGIYYEDLYHLVATVPVSSHSSLYQIYNILIVCRTTPSHSPTPFTSILILFTTLLGLFSWIAVKTTTNPRGDVEHGTDAPNDHHRNPQLNAQRRFTAGWKHYPLVAGESEFNLPLAILRRLSEWVALLESRGPAGGAAIGGMLGCIAAFEDQLTGLEKILTTRLPLVYSVHIRHTVWLYLFFLPFQLTETFSYWTIFGVGIAAFMFLGLLAAGEEIEQPFGCDENDLDMDLFITEIINRDLRALTEMWPYEGSSNGAPAS
ncbi:hypothetical protein FRC11_006235, partial [Ceratobasidium sp. 423]